MRPRDCSYHYTGVQEIYNHSRQRILKFRDTDPKDESCRQATSQKNSAKDNVDHLDKCRRETMVTHDVITEIFEI